VRDDLHGIFTARPEIIDDIRDLNRLVPVDIDPGDPVPFEIGPIRPGGRRPTALEDR
jgi:hypothetical protein